MMWTRLAEEDEMLRQKTILLVVLSMRKTREDAVVRR